MPVSSAPTPPPQISQTGTEIIYAISGSSSTGRDTRGFGFVSTPSSHYSCKTVNGGYAVIPYAVYTITATLISDGDFALDFDGGMAGTSVLSPPRRKAPGLSGGTRGRGLRHRGVWQRSQHVPVAGRILVMDRDAGLASNVDCCYCNCPFRYFGISSVSPSSVTLAAGGTQAFTATAKYVDGCSGTFFYNTVPATWSSSNTTVATVSGNTVTARAAGSATITGTYTDCEKWYVDSTGACQCSVPFSSSGSGTVTVQVPARLVFFNTSCAPNGQGPLQVITNGSVVDCGGVTRASNFCGVNRNLTYQLVDQTGAPFLPAYTISESFSNLSTTNSALGLPTPSQNVPIPANGIVTDAQFVGFTYPKCLGSNDHHSYTQNFSVTAGGKIYNLSTAVSISNGNFNGTPQDNVSITTP